MKNTIKIFLISIAAISAIGAVLYFVVSEWNSAPEFTSTNQYYNEIIQTVNKFSDIEDSANKCDSLYKVVDHKINFYGKENRLNEKEKDAAIEAFMGKYVPIFLSQSFGRFSNSVWNEKELQYMKARTQDLRSLKVRRGSVIEKGSEPDKKIDVILATVNKYYDAKSLIRNKNYLNVRDAKSKIDRAKSLAKDTYLSKCTTVKNSLGDLPEDIHNSHFSEVKIAVHKMYEYQTLDKYDFDHVANHADEMIRDYKDNASSLYGYMKEIGDLEVIRDTQNSNAINHYASLNKPKETQESFTVQTPRPTNTVTPSANSNPANKLNVKAYAPILLKPDPKSKQIGRADNSKIVFLNKHSNQYYRVMQGTLIGYVSVDNIVK